MDASDVTIRLARTADLAGIVAVMNAVDIATLGEPDSSEAEVAAWWAESGFEVERDAFVAQQGERIVGYAEVYDRGAEEAQLDLDVFADPGVDVARIAGLLLESAMTRAAEIDAGARLSTWLSKGDDRIAPFEAAGFRPERLFFRMRAATADAVPYPPPRGIDIRPPLPGIDERAAHAVLVESFRSHVRPLPDSYERFEEQTVHHPDYDPELWALAWRGDTPVGAITVFNHGDVGFIRHVGVLAPERGRGVASALISRALLRLAGRGQATCDLGVDPQDPHRALQLYERLDFTVRQQLALYERG